MKLTTNDLELVAQMARTYLLEMPHQLELGKGPLPIIQQHRVALAYLKAVLCLLNRNGILVEEWSSKIDFNTNVSDSEPETED